MHIIMIMACVSLTLRQPAPCCRWYVASGSLNQPLATPDRLAHAKTLVRRAPSVDSSALDSSSDSDVEDQQADSANANMSDTHTEKQSSSGQSQARAEHCVILMRGVVWKSEEVEMMKLWQNLLRFWPVTFADSLVQPQGALQAHGGTGFALAVLCLALLSLLCFALLCFALLCTA